MSIEVPQLDPKAALVRRKRNLEGILSTRHERFRWLEPLATEKPQPGMHELDAALVTMRARHARKIVTEAKNPAAIEAEIAAIGEQLTPSEPAQDRPPVPTVRVARRDSLMVEVIKPDGTARKVPIEHVDPVDVQLLFALGDARVADPEAETVKADVGDILPKGRRDITLTTRAFYLNRLLGAEVVLVAGKGRDRGVTTKAAFIYGDLPTEPSSEAIQEGIPLPTPVFEGPKPVNPNFPFISLDRRPNLAEVTIQHGDHTRTTEVRTDLRLAILAHLLDHAGEKVNKRDMVESLPRSPGTKRTTTIIDLVIGNLEQGLEPGTIVDVQREGIVTTLQVNANIDHSFPTRLPPEYIPTSYAESLFDFTGVMPREEEMVPPLPVSKEKESGERQILTTPRISATATKPTQNPETPVDVEVNPNQPTMYITQDERYTTVTILHDGVPHTRRFKDNMKSSYKGIIDYMLNNDGQASRQALRAKTMRDAVSPTTDMTKFSTTLAIVKQRLIDLNQGKPIIKTYSKGRDSSFTLEANVIFGEAPVKAEPVEPPPVPDRPVNREVQRFTEFIPGLPILVVDQQPDSLQITVMHEGKQHIVEYSAPAITKIAEYLLDRPRQGLKSSAIYSAASGSLLYSRQMLQKIKKDLDGDHSQDSVIKSVQGGQNGTTHTLAANVFWLNSTETKTREPGTTRPAKKRPAAKKAGGSTQPKEKAPEAAPLREPVRFVKAPAIVSKEDVQVGAIERATNTKPEPRIWTEKERAEVKTFLDAISTRSVTFVALRDMLWGEAEGTTGSPLAERDLVRLLSVASKARFDLYKSRPNHRIELKLSDNREDSEYYIDTAAKEAPQPESIAEVTGGSRKKTPSPPPNLTLTSFTYDGEASRMVRLKSAEGSNQHEALLDDPAMVAVFEFLIKHRNTPITEDMIESTLASLRLPDLSSAAFYIKTIRRRVEGDEEGSLIEDTIFQGKKAYMLKAKRVSRVLVDDDISEIKPAS